MIHFMLSRWCVARISRQFLTAHRTLVHDVNENIVVDNGSKWYQLFVRGNLFYSTVFISRRFLGDSINQRVSFVSELWKYFFLAVIVSSFISRKETALIKCTVHTHFSSNHHQLSVSKHKTSANQPSVKLIHFSPFDVYHVFFYFLSS